MSDCKPRGADILRNPHLNKGSAFTEQERDELGLRGLLPPAITNLENQVERTLKNLETKRTDMGRYVYLQALQDRNENLFFRLLIDNIEELMPVVYTPTVGQACRQFSHIHRNSRGLFISANDRGKMRQILDNWPEKDVKVIVITDGERILGLGDLGANGMGIPIGKLALYTACAGIEPHQCLPVMLDVGTNNEALRDDPLYLGLQQPRLDGDQLTELVDEFVHAVQDAYPTALIQFEDFTTPNAFSLLSDYRDQVLCFNDDIQGTAAVALAGVIASTRITGVDFADLRIMFLGAGSAATGIADLIQMALKDAGVEDEQARKQLWLVDSQGLVVESRENLAKHKLGYAHDAPKMDLISAIKEIKPHLLIGATATPNTFTEEVVRLMSEINERPVLFALSNPTSKAECTAEQAYEWSDGRAVFASGSPFAPVEYQGKTFKPGQGNNAYVFPGIGLGAIACEARIISEEMFLAAANTLAHLVSESQLEAGTLYPSLPEIREVSLAIAVSVAEKAWEQGLAQKEKPADVKKMISELMYDPRY